METGKEVLGMKDLNFCLCPQFCLNQKSEMLQVLGSLVFDLFSCYLSSSFTQLPGNCEVVRETPVQVPEMGKHMSTYFMG